MRAKARAGRAQCNEPLSRGTTADLFHLQPAHARAPVKEAPQLLFILQLESNPPLIIQQPEEGKAVKKQAHTRPDNAVDRDGVGDCKARPARIASDGTCMAKERDCRARDLSST